MPLFRLRREVDSAAPCSRRPVHRQRPSEAGTDEAGTDEAEEAAGAVEAVAAFRP